MTLIERYRQTFNRRAQHGWCVVFGYPIGRFLVVLIEGVRWISPTSLTLVGFLCKLAAAYLLLEGQIVGAVIALQLGTMLDCMDGTLARLRSEYTLVGSFWDKTGDAVGLAAISAAVGWRAYEQTHDARWILVGGAAGAAYAILCYMHWVMRALVKPAAAPTSAAMTGLAEIPSWGAIFKEWLLGWPKLFQMNEGDLYFWMALLAVLDRWTWLATLLGVTQVGAVLARLVMHTRTLRTAQRS